jgi:Ca-activated chloride channel family protein
MTKRALLLLTILTLIAGGTATAQQEGQGDGQQRPRWVIPPPPPEPDIEPEPEPEPVDVTPEGGQQVELSANLVTITVTVRGPSGDLVTDLAPDDFAVYEEGVQQEVDKLYRGEEMPLRLALLFDSSLSIKNRLDFEKRAASRFFTYIMRSGDRVALVSVSSVWRVEQPLTGSAGALVDALDRLKAEGITSLYSAVMGSSRYLGENEGRRVIVLLSDGFDTSGKNQLPETLEVAQKSDVVIYAISPFGGGEATNTAARVGAATLRRLADQTGGVAFFPPIEPDQKKEDAMLDEIYRRLAEELRAQYVLTYYSNSPKDGAFRSLRVDVKRPGLQVLARKGFYAK